jgi:polysaccharide biosynthesis transport protein
MSNLLSNNNRPHHLERQRPATAIVRTSYQTSDDRWEPSILPENGSLLVEYLEVLRRRRGLIALLAVIGAVLGFATTVWRLPVYRARTSLDIQNLNDNFLNRGDVALTSDGKDSTEQTRVQTQIKFLQSETLRQRTMKRIRAKGAAVPIPRNDLFSQAERALGLPDGDEIPSEQLLQYASRHVTVKPLGLTRLVEVTCDSYDPKFSAEYCNTLTSEFSAQDRDVRMVEAQKTSEYLSRQLLDVRASVATAEKQLEAATGHDGLTLPQGGGTVAQQRLADLQAEFMKAQADRIQKESQYDNSLSASPDSLPVVLDSAAYRDQQTRLADLRHQVAMLVPPLTEENPRVKHLRAQIAEAESAELGVKQNILTRLSNEFTSARHREAILLAAYHDQEKKVSAEMTRQNQVSMLRHEVESGQQLYQTLLQRVKEAGFAAAMQASTVRVVDAAALVATSISPRYSTALITGLLIGLLIGTGIAFYKERTQTVLRSPEDVPRYLQLKQLGVIPSVRPSLRVLPLMPKTSSASTSLITLRPNSRPGETTASAREANQQQSQKWLLAEAYRNVTYSILRANKAGRPAKVYVVSSPGAGDGKSTVTCNLGIALAQSNKRVLLIDGDLRRPRLHELTGVENVRGFRNLLSDSELAKDSLDEFCLATPIDNLFVLPTGRGQGEPANLLQSEAMSNLLARLSQQFDLILIDSPPVIHMADARILAGMSNGVILVFRARSTARESAMTARDLFLDDEVEVVGTILNDFDPAREGQHTYYSSFYAYADAVGTEPRSASGSL